jgi:hypothetical protein
LVSSAWDWVVLRIIADESFDLHETSAVFLATILTIAEQKFFYHMKANPLCSMHDGDSQASEGYMTWPAKETSELITGVEMATWQISPAEVIIWSQIDQR